MQFPNFRQFRDKFDMDALSQHLQEHRVSWSLLTGSLGVVVVVLMMGIHHGNDRVMTAESTQAQRAQLIMRQLNDISDEVHTLQANPQNGAALKDTLATINTNLGQVQESISGIKTDMDSQMSDLRKAVQNNGGKEYIDAKNLPFQVVSVDVISEQPYTSVNYDHLVTALPVGNALAGWQLVSADYQKATAEFKNSKDQYIKVIIGE